MNYNLSSDDKIQLELRKFVAPEYIFGTDARLLAANYCTSFGAKKVLLVSYEGVINQPWFLDIENSLRQNTIDYIIYSSVSPNPRNEEVMVGANIYLENKCNLILAIGGGSVLDCAKGIGIVTSNKKHINSFEGVDTIDYPTPPLICIPTTGGTAADVSQFAIINKIEERYKMAIISKAVVPDVALIDPVTLTTMDSFLTACTGIDALSHAFEAFVSNANSPFTDLYAQEAISIIHTNLLQSLKHPTDLDLRGKVMLGSLYAGLAFSNASLGCTHSLTHSLGGYLDLPHGECNAILMPHVVEFNYPQAETRYKRIADILGIPIKDLTTSQIKYALRDKLFQINDDLGITSKLKQRGVNTDDINPLAKKAIADPCNATNPRSPIVSDLKTLYREAM